MGAARFQCGGEVTRAFRGNVLPLMTMLSWSGAHFSARLAQPSLRRVVAGLIVCAGIVTLLAPWLEQTAELHEWLRVLGCRSVSA
jgi:uncharacterized membrane protein YfcA